MSNDVWPAHNVASAIVESMRRHERKPADFYPTPPEAVVALMQALGLPAGAMIGEPACGNGKIVMALAYMGYPCIATDLRNTGFGGHGIDFLDPANDWRWDGVDAMITNPPFKLADAFIRRAVTLAPVVAMLLKSNFFHAGKRVKLWDDCTPTGQLPVSWRLAFLEKERGKSPLMDCTWFVWDRSKPPLQDRPLVRPKPADVPDVSVNYLKPALVALGDACDRLVEATQCLL